MSSSNFLASNSGWSNLCAFVPLLQFDFLRTQSASYKNNGLFSTIFAIFGIFSRLVIETGEADEAIDSLLSVLIELFDDMYIVGGYFITRQYL